MNWKPGDIAITRGCVHAENEGQECTLIKRHIRQVDGSMWPVGTHGWVTESHLGFMRFTHESQLFPLPPPNEVTSWVDCIWQPKVLERVDATP